MRLLIATPLYPPETGGPATYVRALERGLPEHGDTVEVVKFGEVRHLPRIIRHLRYFFRILRAGMKADMILALDPVSVGLPAALAAGLLRKPFVVKVVGDYAWEQGVQRAAMDATLDEFVLMDRVPLLVSILRTVQKFVARSARVIIVPSVYLKSIVITWGIEPARIEVIPNAVSVDTARLGMYDLPPHAIVTSGRLVPWKGMRGLIDALALVRNDVPDATLVIIGDGPERANLEAYAEKTVPDAVRFLGTRTRMETLGYVKAAHAYVLNSTYEGLSHALIEALLLRKPIITTAVGGNPELIRDAENGVIVGSGDTPELARAIVRVLTDKEFTAQLIEGTADARERFALPRMLENTHVCLARAAYHS
jgi:glycosyltransferase involved in cell wall biosynthesis